LIAFDNRPIFSLKDRWKNRKKTKEADNAAATTPMDDLSAA
jgi:hypothetical protein